MTDQLVPARPRKKLADRATVAAAAVAIFLSIAMMHFANVATQTQIQIKDANVTAPPTGH